MKRDGKWGFVNEKGALVGNTIYDAVGEFKMDKFAPVKRDGKWGMIDANGNVVVPIQFNEVKIVLTDDNQNVFIATRRNNKWGVVDTKGNTLVDWKYDEIYLDRYRVAFKVGGKEGHFDATWKEVLQ